MSRKRSYSCNLLFRDRPYPVVDSENENWVLFGDGKENQYERCFSFKNPSLMGISNKGFTTMKVLKANSYIELMDFIDFRFIWEYTISLRYRIDPEWLAHVVKDEKKVSGLQWDDGEVMLYDKRANSDGMCISITIGGERVEAPIDYEFFGYDQPVHLLICMDRLHLKGLMNGILLFDKYIPNPSYLITGFKMGNFLKNGEDSIVEYDELCIVNENLFSKDFKVPTKPFHAIYPEVIIEDENPDTHIGMATNSLIRVNESNQDKLGTLDIVRHVDYEPPQGYQTDRKRKYEYQYLGLEDNVASYKN